MSTPQRLDGRSGYSHDGPLRLAVAAQTTESCMAGAALTSDGQWLIVGIRGRGRARAKEAHPVMALEAGGLVLQMLGQTMPSRVLTADGTVLDWLTQWCSGERRIPFAAAYINRGDNPGLEYAQIVFQNMPIAPDLPQTEAEHDLAEATGTLAHIGYNWLFRDQSRDVAHRLITSRLDSKQVA